MHQCTMLKLSKRNVVHSFDVYMSKSSLESFNNSFAHDAVANALGNESHNKNIITILQSNCFKFLTKIIIHQQQETLNSIAYYL